MTEGRLRPQHIRTISTLRSLEETKIFLKKELGLVVELSSKRNPEERIVEIARQLFMSGRSARWSATDAIALVNPTLLGRLSYPNMRAVNSRSAVHDHLRDRYSRVWTPGITVLAYLREELLREENPDRYLNLEEASRNGFHVNFSTADLQWGFRIHKFSLETYYLFGLLYADGFVSQHGKNRIRLAGQTADESFYRETVAQFLKAAFHIDKEPIIKARSRTYTLPGGRKSRSEWKDVYFDLQSEGLFTLLQDIGFIPKTLAEGKPTWFTGVSGSRLEDLTDDKEIQAYTQGLIAGTGHPYYRKSCEPRLDFTDRRGKYLDELRLLVENLEENVRFSRQGQDRLYLPATEVMKLSRAETTHFLPEQRGYFTHPTHLELVEALEAR